MLKYPYLYNRIDMFDIFNEVNEFGLSSKTYILYKFIMLIKTNIENKFKMVYKSNSIYSFYKIHNRHIKNNLIQCIKHNIRNKQNEQNELI